MLSTYPTAATARHLLTKLNYSEVCLQDRVMILEAIVDTVMELPSSKVRLSMLCEEMVNLRKQLSSMCERTRLKQPKCLIDMDDFQLQIASPPKKKKKYAEGSTIYVKDRVAWRNRPSGWECVVKSDDGVGKISIVCVSNGKTYLIPRSSVFKQGQSAAQPLKCLVCGEYGTRGTIGYSCPQYNSENDSTVHILAQ